MQATEMLSRINLDYGKHGSLQQGACVMECVAYVAGEPHTDHPSCACPVVTKVAAFVNDEYPAVRENGLSSRVLRLAGSNKSPEASKQRAYFLMDFVLRTVTPNSIRRHTPALADAFAQLSPVDCPERMKPVHALVSALRDTLHNLTEGLYLPLRIEDMQSHLEQEPLTQLTRVALEVITTRAPETDMLALLDDLLDIGDTQDIAVDQAVAERIASLATRRPRGSSATALQL